MYALAFPVLLAVSWLGRNSRPAWGAGVLATAVRPLDAPEEALLTVGASVGVG